MLCDILNFFPSNISNILKENIKTNEDEKFLEEIRIRNNQKIILKFNNKEIILDKLITPQDTIKILQIVCENSIYSYQKEICEGFITVKGGHRIGITGNCIIENGRLININYISSLNFRIAKQVIGCSNNVLKHIINNDGKTIYNTLIVSPPGTGKTTILRDIVRNISNGTMDIKGLTVGLVDERGEISAMYKGISQNDIGNRTDVLSNIPKAIGMKMLLRSMAPQVIVADEIGSKEDTIAIKNAICSGVKGIFTAHGENLKDLYINEDIRDLLNSYIFDNIIFLCPNGERGKIDMIYSLDKNDLQYKEIKMDKEVIKCLE